MAILLLSGGLKYIMNDVTLTGERDIVVKVKKIVPNIPLPTKAHLDDAGFDLRACMTGDNLYLYPGQVCSISTGIAVEIPPGYVGNVRPRSGWSKKGLWVAPGTVDAGYRGEIFVFAVNLTEEIIVIENGDRIAQLIIQKLPSIMLIGVEELSVSERGEHGLGSTGVK